MLLFFLIDLISPQERDAERAEPVRVQRRLRGQRSSLGRGAGHAARLSRRARGRRVPQQGQPRGPRHERQVRTIMIIYNTSTAQYRCKINHRDIEIIAMFDFFLRVSFRKRNSKVKRILSFIFSNPSDILRISCVGSRYGFLHEVHAKYRVSVLVLISWMPSTGQQQMS